MALIGNLIKGLKRTKNLLSGGLKTLLSGRQLTPAILDEIEATLIKADIGVHSTMKICEDLQAAYKQKKIVSGDDAIDFLKNELKTYWPDSDRSVHFAQSGPTVILVAGINGCGKTTSVAKLAWRLQEDGKKVMLAAADTFRAAAVEQLTIWSKRIGCEIIHNDSSDPGAVVYDACQAAVARKADVLLIDTAGRIHTEGNLMRELVKIRDVVRKQFPDGPHEVLLVLDATTGQNAISQAKKFMEAIDVTGICLAKLDGTARGGIVVAIRNEINLPVKFIGLGENYQDIEPFDPDSFVEALFA